MRRVILKLMVIIVTMFFINNLPAPWWPCYQKNEGDGCQYGYNCQNNGTCQTQKDCKDNPETEVNECLICKTSPN